MTLAEIRKFLCQVQLDENLVEGGFFSKDFFAISDNEFIIFEKIILANKILKCISGYNAV